MINLYVSFSNWGECDAVELQTEFRVGTCCRVENHKLKLVTGSLREVHLIIYRRRIYSGKSTIDSGVRSIVCDVGIVNGHLHQSTVTVGHLTHETMIDRCLMFAVGRNWKQ